MKKFLLLIIFVTAILSGCGVSNSYTHLSQDDAKKIIQTESNVIILDVRTQEEYEKKHIKNSVLLPIDELRKGNFALLPDKNQKILIYCWTGRRAEASAEILAKENYTNVFEFGGLVDWTGEVEGTEVE
jgi:rhodanese-related sulfurtransferase